MLRQLPFLFLLCLIVAGCQEEIVPEKFLPRDDHRGYMQSLHELELDQSALGADWMAAAEQSVANPHTIEIPSQEEFYVSPQKAEALSYRFEALRGEKLLIEIAAARSDTVISNARLFIDLFREDLESEPKNILVATAEIGTNRLAFEPNDDSFYLLRIQPELLRGGRFTLKIIRGPSLEVPVRGGNNRDIGSFFGDPRPNYRKHHGVDIFAKRHTPIIAPCDGHVRFAGTRGLGGKVVWMRNQSKRLTLYFAHLQDILTEDGAYHKTGDTLGTVGNTGNAITTPPHLHFGIYADGPIDPYHFVALQKAKIKSVQAKPELLGMIARTTTPLKIKLSPEKEISLPRHQWVEVYGLQKNQVRVRLPNGERGLIASHQVEGMSTGIKKEFAQAYIEVMDRASDRNTLISTQPTEQAYEVLARDRDHWFVRTTKGDEGWVLAGP